MISSVRLAIGKRHNPGDRVTVDLPFNENGRTDRKDYESLLSQLKLEDAFTVARHTRGKDSYGYYLLQSKHDTTVSESINLLRRTQDIVKREFPGSKITIATGKTREYLGKLIVDGPDLQDLKWEPATGAELKAMGDKALAIATPKGVKRTRRTLGTYYERNRTIREFRLNVNGDCCDYCGKPAEHRDKHGKPLFQSHHLGGVAESGDAPWVIGIVHANCHDAAHRASNKKEINAKIAKTVAEKKAQYDNRIRLQSTSR